MQFDEQEHDMIEYCCIELFRGKQEQTTLLDNRNQNDKQDSKHIEIKILRICKSNTGTEQHGREIITNVSSNTVFGDIALRYFCSFSVIFGSIIFIWGS